MEDIYLENRVMSLMGGLKIEGIVISRGLKLQGPLYFKNAGAKIFQRYLKKQKLTTTLTPHNWSQLYMSE